MAGPGSRLRRRRLSDSRVQRVGKFQLSDTGDLEGKLTVIYTGLEAMNLRLEERHADEVARKNVLQERATSQIGGAAEAELTNKPDWTSSGTPLVAEFTVKISNWTSSTGKRVLLPAAIFTAHEKGMFEHATRIYPIYFDYPYQKTDDITVELPPGWHIASKPTSVDKDEHVIRYALKVDAGGDEKLHLYEVVLHHHHAVRATILRAAAQFSQIVRSGDAEQIVLTPGEMHAAN